MKQFKENEDKKLLEEKCKTDFDERRIPEKD
jgi:hypothetical protein